MTGRISASEHVVISRAIAFATEAHQSQVRKGNGDIPYIFHPIDVANEVIYYSGLPEGELGIAAIDAILHDTVEDTSVTLEDIRLAFGDVVADDIASLTKDTSVVDSGHSKRQSLLENLGRLQAGPLRVQAVKLADRVSNLKSFPGMWGWEKIAHYLDESALIATKLAPASEILHARLVHRIAEQRQMLSLYQRT